MDVRLRAHHLENLGYHKRLYPDMWKMPLYLVPFVRSAFIQIMGYGPRFFINTFQFMNRIDENSKITIVEGPDDFCRICPLYDSCLSDNKGVIKQVAKWSKFVAPLSKVPDNMTTDDYDKIKLRQYRLYPGETYGLEELLYKFDRLF